MSENDKSVQRPRGGRPKGAVNLVKREAAAFARSVVQSPEYVEWLWERVTNRTLHPETEKLLWQYAYGRPPEHIQLNVSHDTVDLAELSLDELATLTERLSADIRAMDLEEAQHEARVATMA